MPDNEKPDCFADIDIVFPMSDNGLRESPKKCMFSCPYKTECLKTAMSSGPKTTKAQEDKVDKTIDSGMTRFFERWSRKKYQKKNKK